MGEVNRTLYLKHRDGATHALSGRRCAKLFREIRAGRGNPEVTRLVEAGYVGFLGDSDSVDDFENLDAYVARRDGK